MHPKTLAVANLLGVIYTAVGRYEDSLNVLHDTLERCRQTLGVEHPFTLGCKLSLAASLRSLGKQEEAIPYLEESFGGYEKTLGEKHPKTLAAMGVLGTTYIDVGRVEEGAVLLRRTVELKKSTLGETHKETLSTIQILARAMVMQDKLDDAKSLLIECLDRQVKKDSQGWEADTVRIQLGGVLLAQKDFEGALKHLRAGYRGMSKPGTPIPPAIRKQQLSKALEGLISLANATEREAIVPKLQQKLEALNATETNSK
jgi:tetratricopeptide (TPR) repeat protein